MEAVVMSDVILLFVNLRDEKCSLQNLIECKLKFLVSKFGVRTLLIASTILSISIP